MSVPRARQACAFFRCDFSGPPPLSVPHLIEPLAQARNDFFPAHVGFSTVKADVSRLTGAIIRRSVTISVNLRPMRSHKLCLRK